MLHAPSASIYWGNLLEPDLSSMPADLTQDSFTCWQAACQSDTGVKCDMLARRAFGVCLNSAVQTDRFGNLNIMAIGDHRNRRSGLPAASPSPSISPSFPARSSSSSTSTATSSFITSVGHLWGGRSHEEAGLSPGGPQLVVTGKSIFDFDPGSRHSLPS
ncbi:hypothetical protein [Azospirillum sp. B506]|uniref:hypothetical protein n=1 Tax=Azospirillum sp. B506 TaxID=137721 RepID=UPI000344E144|nr:hypothetical protein [Azospirillum sp. B506]